MINTLRYIILLFTAFPLWSFSQDSAAAYAINEEFTIWNLSVGDTAFVYADNAYLRSYPSLEGQVTDSLVAGTPLIIKSPAYNSNKIKGFSAPWHEVVYNKDGETKKAFIWLGLLALGHKEDATGHQYLYGYERFYPYTENDSDHYSCAIKRLDAQHNIVAKFSFRADYQGQSYTQCKLLSGMGLDGIQQIFRVEFIGEACGIPSNYYYTGWTENSFVDMPGRYTVSDAGVFYYEEKILFPSEHKKEPNMLYKYIEEGEVIDENTEELDYKIKRKEEKYLWNGQHFTQIIELKQP